MSWIKENYHVASLGVGALALAGLGFVGFSNAQGVKDGFNDINSNKGDTTTATGGDIADDLSNSIDTLDVLEAQKTSTGRPVHLFTSVDLFTKDGNNEELFDLLADGVDTVHPPIPNQWWVDHQIDPSMSDAPSRDADGDGFTNLEEFRAKTDPQNNKVHGDLIGKLEIDSIKSAQWLVLFNSVLGDGFQFNYRYKKPGERRLDNRMGGSDVINEGEIFFKEGAGQGRFKFVKVEPRMEDTPTGRRNRNYAIIEDQRPNKMGDSFAIPYNMSVREKRENTRYDHTVTFSLNAIGESGNKIVVEENGSFGLPSSSADKPYQLAEVVLDERKTPIKVIIKWLDDEKEMTREIPIPAPKK